MSLSSGCPGLHPMISGIGVFYPDKTPIQGVGIKPEFSKSFAKFFRRSLMIILGTGRTLNKSR